MAGFCIYAQNIKPNAATAADTEAEAFNHSKIWNAVSFKTAFDKYIEASEKWGQVERRDRQILCLIEASRLIFVIGKPGESRSILEKSLSIANRYDLFEEIALVKAELSRISLEAGQTDLSRKLINEALAADKRLTDPTIKASLYFCAGEFFYNQRNIEKSAEFYSKSADFSQIAGDLRTSAKSLVFLAYSRLFQNNFDASLENLNTALAKFRELADQRGIGLAYVALGNLYSSMDKKQLSLDAYQKAEQIFPDDLDFVDKARLLNGMGSIYEDYEEWNLSIRYRMQALDYFIKADYKYGQLATLTRLGSLFRFLENSETANNYLTRSKSLAVELNDYLFNAIIEEELGHLFFDTNLYQKAVEHYQIALEYFKKNPNPRETALIADKLGQIYFHQNDFQQARSFFLKSIELNQKVQNKFAESQANYNLALLEAKDSKTQQALVNIKNSLNLTEIIATDVLNSKLKRTYFSNVFARYELYIQLLMKMQKEKPAEDLSLTALQAAEKSRARILVETLSMSNADFTKDANPETIKRENEIRVLLNSKADKLTDLLSQNAEKTETDKISGEINELENELENIKAALKLNSPIYSAIKNPAPFDVGEFQQNILDENSLLLEFSFGAEQSYLWLVEKNSVSSFILPPRREIETHIEKLRQLLASREMGKDEKLEDFQLRIREAETLYKTEAKLLSDQLFGQIADKISNKRLIIVPDGKLHYFPVSALPLPDSDSDEPLLTTNETVYAPSAQTLLILEKSRRQADEASKNLLIFSDPIFTSEDSRFSTANKLVENSSSKAVASDSFRFVESLNTLPRLTASKNESDAIIDIIGASNADNFSGFDANREQLLKIAAGDYKILHFATHGITDEKRPELSGIVLSRFNANGQKQDEFFRIHDIYGLNLNADLVVLSACSTGIGKEVKGEGLMSLNNAFLQTGAKSVMASLWKVEDRATQELMKHFYRGMVDEGLTPSQSLRQAQIELRKNSQFKSPFYWAAFTVQGDFRNVPQFSKQFENSIYLFAFIPIALIGFYLFRIRKRFFASSS